MRFLFALTAAFVVVSACADQATNTNVPPSIDGGGPTDAPADPDANGTTRRPGVIRVATFNVHRYFDTVCDTGKCAAGDFEEVVTQAQFDAVTAKLAAGIALLDPDIIALEEVETVKCLDALASNLAASGKSFPIVHIGETGSPGSVDVAILARGALSEIKTHRDSTPLVEADGTKTTFARELLEIRMTFGAQAVVMFAAHFRSQAADDPARRLAEAKAAQGIIAKTSTDLPNALVLLGGDLNDQPGSDAINALEQGGALLRVASDLPAADQGTYLFQGQRQAIDHIFVGAPQKARYLPKSAQVYRDDMRGFAGSDHAALAADFSIQ